MKKVKSLKSSEPTGDSILTDPGLQVLLESLTDVVFSLDNNARFSYLNSAWQQQTGYAIDDSLGQSITQFCHQHDDSSLDQLLDQVALGQPIGIISIHQQLLLFDAVINKHSGGYQGCLRIITDSQETAESGRDNTGCFRQMVESMAVILFRIDSHACIDFVNLAWSTITGYSNHETLGTPIQDFVYQEDLEKVQKCLDDNAYRVQIEFRLRCKGNEQCWVLMALTKQIVNGSKEPLITGSMQDISQHKQLEYKLLQGQQRYALLASSTTDGIWDWDLKNDQVVFSPRWKSMLGYADDEILNQFDSWSLRVHEDDIDQAMLDVIACLEGKTAIYENIHRMQHRDGSWVWIHDRGTVLRDENGTPYRMVGSHSDVTLLKKTEQAMREQRRELQAIFSGSPDGIVTVTRLGKIQSINQAFLAMTGFDEHKLIGLSLADFENCLVVVSGAGLSSFRQNNNHFKVFHLDSTKLRQHPFACKRNSQKGFSDNRTPKTLVLSLTERQIFDHDLAKIMYFRDISVESEVDYMKSEFLSTAAHELRTPMASVFGFSELLLSQQFDGDTTREIVRTIHQQSQSLVNMLNQLLDLARIESRIGLDFNFSKQPLWPIIIRSIAELLIPGDNRVVKLNKPNVDYLVEVDADKLRQVISNVLVNAYKYSPQDSDISLSIEVQKHADVEREIGIVIQDHGIGMSEEQLSHIYERFWRADNSSLIPGTGLGMALVKEIMNIHQGQIDIKTELGLGTTVTLWIKQYADEFL